MTQTISYCDLPLFQKSLPHRKDFAEYDAENPQIWLTFERIALQLISQGKEHFSAKAIFEIIRFQTGTTESGKDTFFRINNTYTQGYARKFIKKHPEHKDFFELRGTRRE